jgi:autotransporter-associated beta strand protein
VDFGGSIGPNSDGRITAGSIAGSGTYYIGAGNLLTVGGNNLSTEVSGVIADFNPCGCGPVGPGNLEKVGTGTLILSGTNTYTGGTLVDGVPCWWPARSRVPPSCLSITVRRSVARVRFR